jgi:hypothetical protein
MPHKPTTQIAPTKIDTDEPLIRGLEYLLTLIFGLLAVSVVLFIVGSHTDARFSHVAIAIVSTTVLAALSSAFRATVALKKHPPHPNTQQQAGLLLAVSLLGAATSAWINRPDGDDAIYAPKAVFYTEHSDAPVDGSISWIAADFQLPESGQLPYYELTQAAFAWALSTPFLEVYHRLFPGLVILLSGISLFLLIRLFLPDNPSALAGAVAWLLLMLLLGETHRTYGNLSIARAFQAKGFFIATGLPAWTYFTLRYLRKPSLRGLLILGTISLALSGATTTAMALIPILSVTLVMAHQAQKGLPGAQDLKTAGGYFLSLIPLGLMTASFYPYAKTYLGKGQSINAAFPGTFAGQMEFLINPQYPLTPILMGLSFLLVIFFSDQRRFFLAWIGLLLLFFINPITAPAVMAHITSENIYWRLLYLLPFPLTACLMTAKLYRPAPTLTGALLIMLSWAALSGPTSVFRADNHVWRPWAPYKINPAIFADCQTLKDRLPPGSMLAPLDLSDHLILLTSAYPQFHTRQDFLQFILQGAGHSQDFVLRERAYAYLVSQTSSPDNREHFQQLINAHFRPRHVITPLTGNGLQDRQTLLTAAGYTPALVTHNHQVFSLPP